MAIDNRLQVFNEQDEPVDYDILASDVKFLPDGKDLPTKLAEMQQEIDEAGGYTPPAGGIPKTDLSQSVQDTLDDVANKVDKETGKGLSTNDYTDVDKTKLANLPTNPVQSISVNGGTAQTPTNGNVNINVQGGGLTKEDISVETQGDGTVDINVADDTYKINMNHTHENMAKLEKFVASNPPASMANDTIYAQVDNLTTPTEIQSLWLFGCEFAGGVPNTGMPQVINPSIIRPLNLGTNTGSGVTALVDVKARNLNYNGSTDGLTVSVGQNSGLLLSYDQTVDATSITIPQLDAETGCQITVKYTGSGALADGALVFSHDNAVLVSVIVVVVAPVALSAIKLTGTQWLKTDYYPNQNTEFELDVLLDNYKEQQGIPTTGATLMSCAMNTNTDTNKIFRLYTYYNDSKYKMSFANDESVNYNGSLQSLEFSQQSAFMQRSVIKWVKGSTKGSIQFGGLSHDTSLKTTRMQNPLRIGYGASTNTAEGTADPDPDKIYKVLDATIYGLKITEGGTTVRNYVPATLNGVPGLHDTITGAFISSETSTPVVAIE